MDKMRVLKFPPISDSKAALAKHCRQGTDINTHYVPEDFPDGLILTLHKGAVI